MADCPSCGAVLVGKLCGCGYAVRNTPAQIVKYSSRPQQDVTNAFNAKHRETLAQIEKYRKEHPGTSVKDACFAIRPSVKTIAKDLDKQLGKHFDKNHAKSFDDAMDDYRESDDAIGF